MVARTRLIVTSYIQYIACIFISGDVWSLLLCYGSQWRPKLSPPIQIEFRWFLGYLEFYGESGVWRSDVQNLALNLIMFTLTVLFDIKEAITRKSCFRSPVFIEQPFVVLWWRCADLKSWGDRNVLRPAASSEVTRELLSVLAQLLSWYSTQNSSRAPPPPNYDSLFLMPVLKTQHSAHLLISCPLTPKPTFPPATMWAAIAQSV